MARPRFLNFAECLDIKSGYLVTVNLQHLYECQSDSWLRGIIFADKNVHVCLDGRGAKIIFERWLGARLPLAVGNEILRAWLQRPDARRVLVIGSDKATLAHVRQRFSRIAFTHDDTRFPVLDSRGASDHAAAIVARYGTGFSFIAVALSVPKQEVLAKAIAAEIPDVPILCIGGSFEMLAGRFRRAPELFQRLGLEGVWRLLLQPNRDRLFRIVRTYWHFIAFAVDSRKIRALVEHSDDKSRHRNSV